LFFWNKSGNYIDDPAPVLETGLAEPSPNLMYKFLRVLVFCFFSVASFAQSPSLSIIRVNAENYCLGTELSIDVDVNGAFPAGNKFTVVVYYNWGDLARRWEYPADLRVDKLITVLKEPALAGPESFNIAVITSNPHAEIFSSNSYRAHMNGTVALKTRWGYTADTLNSTDPISMVVVANPSPSGTVTLNSGENFSLKATVTPITLPRTKAGAYFIKEASNTCGPIRVTGEQVNIKVNSIDFKPVAISPANPCAGGEVKVIFNTDGGEFNANTRFSIRFSSDNLNFDSNRYRDAPAVLTGKNELTARIPENVLYGMESSRIYIGIVTQNPSAVSINKALAIYVHARPSFTLQPEKSTINLGETIYLAGNPTGKSPFKITLTSGEVMASWIQISPVRTTNYQVKTFESGCGVIENPVNAPVTITVRQSLLLTSSGKPEIPAIFCEGHTARLGFKAIDVPAQISYMLEATTNSGRNFLFPARVVGDSLEFSIPKNTNPERRPNYGDITSARVVSNNPNLTSPFISIRIQSLPTIVPGELARHTVPFPSAARLDFDLFGGAPYTVEFTNGVIATYEYGNITMNQFVKRDSTFTLTRLSNACFVNNNLPTFPIKVVDPASTTPSVFAKLIKKNYCMGDSVEVEMSFSGQFEPGNQFTLSYLKDAQIDTYLIQNLTKPGIYKVKLPVRDGSYVASLQLSSTLPRLVSETERFYLGVPPRSVSIGPVGQKSYPVNMYLGDMPSVTVDATAKSAIVYSIDGVESHVIADHNGKYGAPLPLQHGKTSEFKLKSVTNSCGSWNGDIISYYHGIRYKVVITPPMNSVYHCVGTEAEVYFSLENGSALPDTKFTLQFSQSGDEGSFTDMATVTDRQMFSFLVPNMEAGAYYIRIHSSDNIYSGKGTMLIGQAPIANFKSDYPIQGASHVTVDYGTRAYMTTGMKGNTPWGIRYSDGEQQHEIENILHTYSPIITGQQTFTVNKVWNSCGYGTATGSVTVNVKPVLELSKWPNNSDPTICPGQKIQLDYAFKGADLPAQTYLVFSMTDDQSRTVKLDSVLSRSGRIELGIPDHITAQRFTIKAEIASLQLSKVIGYALFVAPDMTLFGDNTITSGESTKLFIRANSTFPYNTSFEMSDGKTYLNTAPYPGGITEAIVTPGVTTTYTLKPKQSECGTGKISGSATITVQPKSVQWLSIWRVEGLRQFNICSSDTVRVYYDFHGNQGIDDLDVLLSDSTGKNFVSIPTSGQYSPLMAIIPAGIKKSNFYRLRLHSNDRKVSGTTFFETVKIGERARAKVLTPSVFYKAGQSVNVVVGLEGSSPFNYRYGDENFVNYRNTRSFSDTIKLSPLIPLAGYKISRLSNACGPGTIDEPSSFRIELVTGTEPVGEVVRFGPNPTAGELLVLFENNAMRRLNIVNVAGQEIFSGKYTGSEAKVDLSASPAGVYLLQIRKNQSVVTYRIVKY
jgi:hypothetical protein